jgi:proteasome accessory factor C
MVPYFQANPQLSYSKAANDLGVTRKQLEADINQLWICGMPGYTPGDLIDFELTDDTINVTFSAGIDRPLRLTSTEATGLLMALRALAEIPGVVDPAAARSASAKIESAAGTAEADAQSTRVVDPMRVVLVGDQSYLEAWSREAEGVRLFRFDRILDAAVLDEPAAPPDIAMAGPPNTALFDADPSLPAAALRIAPGAAWMLEYFPMRMVAELPDGHREVAMTYAAEEWLVRQILGFGGDVAVLGPPALVERVRQSAAEAVAAYRALES